jgi:hypothetical protein
MSLWDFRQVSRVELMGLDFQKRFAYSPTLAAKKQPTTVFLKGAWI